MRVAIASIALVAAVSFSGVAVAQNQQRLTGTGQFCIKGASGPIKCDHQTAALCEQARPQGSTEQCVSRSEAEGTVGGPAQREPAPAPGSQKD
jgi:hypothetical protein